MHIISESRLPLPSIERARVPNLITGIDWLSIEYDGAAYFHAEVDDDNPDCADVVVSVTGSNLMLFTIEPAR